MFFFLHEIIFIQLVVTSLEIKSIKDNLFRFIIHLMIIPELSKLLKTIMQAFGLAFKQLPSTGSIPRMVGS